MNEDDEQGLVEMLGVGNGRIPGRQSSVNVSRETEHRMPSLKKRHSLDRLKFRPV